MSDREKLIELIANGYNCPTARCCDCKYYFFAGPDGHLCCNADALWADTLIANGVTFATDNNDGGKWVPVTEGLPKYTGIYFTTNTKAAGKIRVEDLWFEDGQFYEATYGGFKERKVTHWAKLPEPPEGD
jgi:hypothetical protein